MKTVYSKELTDAEILFKWISFPKNHPRYSGEIRLLKGKDGFFVEMNCQSVKTGNYIYDCRPTRDIAAFRAVMEMEKKS